MGRSWIVCALAAGSALLMLCFGAGYVRAASVLMNTVGIADPTPITGWVQEAVVEEDVLLSTAGGDLRGRYYLPAEDLAEVPVLLVHGIHPEGIDEPRLRGLARALAAVGHPVLTPELDELASLSATPQTVERIVCAAKSLKERTGRRVLGVGISVGGGLTLLAARGDAGAETFVQVAAIGSHASLSRVARYYAGDESAGRGEPPHPYGIRVLAYAHAEQLFAPEDTAEARRILKRCLDRGTRSCRPLIPRLSADGQALLLALLDDVRGPLVQARLRRAIGHVAEELSAVSPEGELAELKVPVLLMHGVTDPVIPASELQHLTEAVPPDQRRASLLTPVLSHTGFPKGVGAGEYLKVVRFVAQMLSPE